jgi:hypothetical protein
VSVWRMGTRVLFVGELAALQAATRALFINLDPPSTFEITF